MDAWVIKNESEENSHIHTPGKGVVDGVINEHVQKEATILQVGNEESG
jgi:hypothetical protein